MNTTKYSTASLLSLTVLFASHVIAPKSAESQNYNKNYNNSQHRSMYNRVLRQTGANYPGKKRFDANQAEATTLDVDAIVREEERARRRNSPGLAPISPQQLQRLNNLGPRGKGPKRRVSPYGCGIYGLDPCYE